MRSLTIALWCLPVLLPGTAHADAPKIEAAWLEGSTVHVTLSHPDTGWDHYADGWEVLDQNGLSLGIRELAHPHEAEQPFTRSLRLDDVPDGPLFVRARCNVDGWTDDRAGVSRD
ncbi:hypothetical protein [Maritimibacter dapengensis]|uniref:Secreted protein n=1 Tax=Maritimibacter dapengensis TaxID=2836868 RepID=A0ABS6SY88_9RHOB|nr:hypothetical protein [Maritimibacter dapengensis]MBV7377933.1 hypothetical protein [Maritimibacter dapengensis]